MDQMKTKMTCIVWIDQSMDLRERARVIAEQSLVWLAS